MIDSHCHLADDAFADDVEAVVSRAADAGVSQAMCILEGGNDTEERRAGALVSRWPWVRTSIGVHPHIAGQFREAPARAADVVRAQLTRTSSARAVGEIGLDYHYDHSPREVQQAACSRRRSPWPSTSTCRSSSTRARPTRIRWRS